MNLGRAQVSPGRPGAVLHCGFTHGLCHSLTVNCRAVSLTCLDLEPRVFHMQGSIAILDSLFAARQWRGHCVVARGPRAHVSPELGGIPREVAAVCFGQETVFILGLNRKVQALIFTSCYRKLDTKISCLL